MLHIWYTYMSGQKREGGFKRTKVVWFRKTKGGANVVLLVTGGRNGGR